MAPNVSPVGDPAASDRWTCFNFNEAQNVATFGNETAGGTIRECDEREFNWEAPPAICSGKQLPPYTYTPVSTERSTNMVLSALGYEYPSPGFYVVLPNSNGTQASYKYATLYQSKFIDLQTRALFVDINYWNLNLNRLITVKFVFELPIYGGVDASYQARVADVYQCSPLNLETCKTSDFVRMSFEVVCLFAIICVTILVILQVCMNFFKLIAWNYGWLKIDHDKDPILTAFKTSLINGVAKDVDDGGDPAEKYFGRISSSQSLSGRGRKVKQEYHTPPNLTTREIVDKNREESTIFQKLMRITFARPMAFWFWNMFLVAQIIVYFGYLVSRWIAFDLVPQNYDVAGDKFIDFLTPCLWVNYGDRLNALFIFLSWVRLFEFINYFSGHGLMLFVFMFFAFICGSALSNQIAFGFYVENYSSFSNRWVLRGDITFCGEMICLMKLEKNKSQLPLPPPSLRSRSRPSSKPPRATHSSHPTTHTLTQHNTTQHNTQ